MQSEQKYILEYSSSLWLCSYISFWYFVWYILRTNQLLKIWLCCNHVFPIGLELPCNNFALLNELLDAVTVMFILVS